MKGLPVIFTIISAEVWVGGEQWYRSVFWFFFPLQAFTDIYFLFPVAVSDWHGTIRYFLHIFSSAKTFSSIPVAIRYFMINESFCLCGRRCAVVSSIYRLFSCMNCYMWAIQ